MRLRIDEVFEHYAAQSEYYKRANIAQRFEMEDAFYRLTMELLGKIIGRLRSWGERYQLHASSPPHHCFGRSRTPKKPAAEKPSLETYPRMRSESSGFILEGF
jgi:hypothetical protein